MKWFDLGKLLFLQWKKISLIRAVILFPLTILYFVFWIINFLLFFVQYILCFPLEASGIDNTSGIKPEDDPYVKKSKLAFGIIISIFFSAYMIITQTLVYFPISIFALWMDAIGWCIFKKNETRFEICKKLLNR